MTLIDAVGFDHAPVDPAHVTPRIISLVPSITELLFDLGLEKWIVGRTGFCIHPDELVRQVPKVGGTKDVNIEKIRALAPTHLIVNIDENEKPTVQALARFVPHIVVTHPIAPRDNLGLYRLLGGIFCASEKAEALCAAFEHSYAALAAQRSLPSKTVLYCIWQDPWMTVSSDTYIARMLLEIGWQHWQILPVADATIAAGPEAETKPKTKPKTESKTNTDAPRYPRFDWSDVLVDGIDEVLLSTEPYRFTDAHADALEKQIGKPVRLVDGEMFSWYGSRAIYGLRYLKELADGCV